MGNILSPCADSSMLLLLWVSQSRFLFRNHAYAAIYAPLCLNLRRTNKILRKGVDSFSTLPIMRLHTAGVISSVGRASPLHGGGRRFEPVIAHHFGSLAQLVEQLTFNQLVAGSNPARPTNVKKRPKGAFLLSAVRDLTPGGTAFARPTVSAVRFVGRVSEAPPDMPMSTFSLKLSKKMPI